MEEQKVETMADHYAKVIKELELDKQVYLDALVAAQSNTGTTKFNGAWERDNFIDRCIAKLFKINYSLISNRGFLQNELKKQNEAKKQ